MHTKQLLAGFGALALVGAVALPAQAEAFRVGVLTCQSGPRVGKILGSTQSMSCEFRSNTNADRRYVYKGRIRRLGVDLGATRGGTFTWAVFAKNSRIAAGTLRGNYLGASGSVAIGFGLGANVLVGGSRRSIALQPVSIESSTGLNLAAGVSRLTLSPRAVRH
jgi:hypothetical protein